MRLLVAIPCLNEAQTISSVVSSLPRQFASVREVVSLVVDDGSTDDTAGVARRAGAVVISHAGNRGLGRAFETAVEYALSNDFDVLVNNSCWGSSFQRCS
jgi:glycosyltransferase involved in cell wall biosynthesis